MGDLVIFPTSPDRPVRPPTPSLPIIPVTTDAELATERARLDRKLCRHEDGRVGYADGVWREGLVVLAKLWRSGRFDPVRASRLTPIGGQVA